VKHDNNFDLLRLFAACQVVYMHGVFQLKLPSGGLFFDLASAFPGVACFFIISGFLVSKSYLDSTIPAYFFASSEESVGV
jgi:peptidoglycan/LPS O-acetylase OafA/YrhL